MMWVDPVRFDVGRLLSWLFVVGIGVFFIAWAVLEELA